MSKNCLICGNSMAEPQSSGDWQYVTMLSGSAVHWSCAQIFDEIRAEEKKVETERQIRLARARYLSLHQKKSAKPERILKPKDKQKGQK